MACSSLRTAGHVVLNNRPCKIVELSTSMTGKHGRTKAHLTGIDIFGSKKYEGVFSSTQEVDVPVISRNEYKLVCFLIYSFPWLLKTITTTGTITDAFLFRLEPMMITFCWRMRMVMRRMMFLFPRVTLGVLSWIILITMIVVVCCLNVPCFPVSQD